ncbi:MAG: sugar transferase [Actinomycetia bacterium]|nr:sugar transferase [Actinomycetes bacterium]
MDELAEQLTKEALPRGLAGQDLSNPDTVLDLRDPEPLVSTRPRLVSVPDSFYIRWLKRALDFVAASTLLIVLSPILLGVTIAVRMALGPGVIFRQDRVGFRGRPFRILKFRTMRHPWEISSGPSASVLFKQAADSPRQTRLGRFLRVTSLDELPQLWNVVKGEMSLIGPRPLASEIADHEDLWHHPRHLVRPGLSGLWQVSELRNRPLQDGVDLDIEYVRTMGLLVDSRIAVRTLVVVATGRGA